MGRIEKFKDQSYKAIRRKHIESKDLFEDPLFPANDHSLSVNKPLGGTVVWKRPSELASSPRLFVDKASAHDVTQGKLGNCWFVAACSALATVKPLWTQVVPDYKLQEWDPTRPDEYVGVFHFRFWRFGKWIDVVVDDRLPTVEGELIFCHSTTTNEFWSALLEKAYAKLCGSYGAMDGGNLCDALVDFTSGLAEMILLKEGYRDEPKKGELRKIMLREYEDHALMCCAISVSDSSQFEARTSSGLVVGHAYGVTAVKEITVGTSTGLLSFFKTGEKITLLRLRNPWGAKEWNGPFSDGEDSRIRSREKAFMDMEEGSSRGASSAQVIFVYSPEQLLRMNSRSPEWTKISKHEKEKLGLTFEDDGEFWMPYNDFVSEFTDLSICRLVNTSIFTFRKSWYENCCHGQWTIPNQAGGCPNHATFLKNPQYYFDVPQNDMELMVQLLQTDLRGKQESSAPGRSVDYKSIGFHIMEVEQNRRYRVHKKGKKAITSDYVLARGVFYRGTLNKGRYVIVPTTFEPNIETEFYLRMYTEAKVKLIELKEDFPEPSWLCQTCCDSPTAVTVVHVEGVHGLPRPMDTYCVVKSERESLQSHVVSNSDDPMYNLHGIFFRYDICKPLVVEIWERRLLRDKFLGCAFISGSADNETSTIKSPLVGKGQKREEKQPGELRLSVTTYDEPDAA